MSEGVSKPCSRMMMPRFIGVKPVKGWFREHEELFSHMNWHLWVLTLTSVKVFGMRWRRFYTVPDPCIVNTRSWPKFMHLLMEITSLQFFQHSTTHRLSLRSGLKSANSYVKIILHALSQLFFSWFWLNLPLSSWNMVMVRHLTWLLKNYKLHTPS